MASTPAPEAFPRRVLVCLVGLSPQVVTETLYALACTEQPPFVATELHIVTTTAGAALVRERLCGPDGALAALADNYPVLDGLRHAATLHLHLVQRDGRPLDDIDSVADHSALADTILDVLQPLASDAGCAIHASIAGGRKSMGFYLGYVLSLLGRPQDRLSHVLVNKPFESNPHFYFPPARPRQIVAANGQSHSTLSASVVLAPVSFVRLSPRLREPITGSGLNFDTLVARAQWALDGLSVEVAPATRELRVPEIDATVRLEKTLMLWYTFFALRRLQGSRERDELVEPGFVRVAKDPSRAIGFDASQLTQAARRCDADPVTQAPDPEALRYLVSSIRKELVRGFGTEVGERLAIVGPGDRGRRDSQYGLARLEAARIRIV